MARITFVTLFCVFLCQFLRALTISYKAIYCNSNILLLKHIITGLPKCCILILLNFSSESENWLSLLFSLL